MFELNMEFWLKNWRHGLAQEIRDQKYLDILDLLATESEIPVRITHLFQSQYKDLRAALSVLQVRP